MSWDSKPSRFFERPGKGPLEIARCEADGGIVILGSQLSLGLHAGHRMRQPVILTAEENKNLQTAEV